MVAYSGQDTSTSLEAARSVLKSVWGYSDLRYHQRKAVLACLRGRDCLAVLPTGGGKSICFQLPALLLPGLTLVVSPLISLMQDQVAALSHRGVAAAYLSSTQKPHLQRSVKDAIAHNRLKLLYVAPERLKRLGECLEHVEVSLLAVDEAHCISEWGHDFRPHFRSIGRYRRRLGSPPTIAVTATATPETQNDIVRVLGLSQPVRVAQSFDRPNLYFAARRFDGERGRVQETARLLRTNPGTAIAYVQTRNRADGIASILRRWSFHAAPYHARLPANARRTLLRRFIQGDIRVMVATNAFGMGIDKSDVRLVVHLGIPARPESYYQEAGRAGRDGHPSRCELLWTDGDLRLAARMSLSDTDRTRRSAAKHLEAKKRGLDTMRHYVRTAKCRRRVVLGYLGEDVETCSGCDSCDRSR
ncbi:MAG: ATP-dependent DNA helicase RecQ, partial [Gemmatimonadota bacterium]